MFQIVLKVITLKTRSPVLFQKSSPKEPKSIGAQFGLQKKGPALSKSVHMAIIALSVYPCVTETLTLLKLSLCQDGLGPYCIKIKSKYLPMEFRHVALEFLEYYDAVFYSPAIR